MRAVTFDVRFRGRSGHGRPRRSITRHCANRSIAANDPPPEGCACAAGPAPSAMRIIAPSAKATEPAGKDQLLVPTVGVLWETGTLYPYDAEALACRRLHHHPALKAVHNLRAQLLQTRHFCRDVVGLDVYVDATLVLHALDLHDQLVRWGLQHAIVAAAAGMLEVHGATECLTPIAGGLVHIGGFAVDQHSAEAGMVHTVASHANLSSS